MDSIVIVLTQYSSCFVLSSRKVNEPETPLLLTTAAAAEKSKLRQEVIKSIFYPNSTQESNQLIRITGNILNSRGRMSGAPEDEPMALDVRQQNPGPAPTAVSQPNAPPAAAAGTGDNIIPGNGGGAGGSNNPVIQDQEAEGPTKKKPKLDMDTGAGDEQQPHVAPKIEKLENRLVSLLCCTVCLDLPRAAIYQCTNGHLMCAGCFTHLLADARLRDEVSTCPNCRIEINKHSATRNLAVEKAVNELPSECNFCGCEFPRHAIARHERELCEERTMKCKFERIGCPWRGPFHELANHEATCNHPSKTGEEVMGALRLLDQNAEDERKLYRGLFDFLSYEKIHIGDLQFKPYRTDEFVHKLYYETSRFTAFNNQWVVKARINNHQRDPTLSVERQMTYQLILKSKPAAALDVNFVILKGAFGDMKIRPQIDQFTFTETNMESTSYSLALQDSAECNRLLAAKTIHFRLIAFLQ